ncbi:MAG: hypothetical protein K1000chlam3_01123 [Chlamydiae bacterium]|nr:hypothetical protein [Chlamydiota bacterium]
MATKVNGLDCKLNKDGYYVFDEQSMTQTEKWDATRFCQKELNDAGRVILGVALPAICYFVGVLTGYVIPLATYIIVPLSLIVFGVIFSELGKRDHYQKQTSFLWLAHYAQDLKTRSKLYTFQFKNWFLTTSAIPQVFRLFLAPCL